MSIKKIDEFSDLPTSVSLVSNKKVISELQSVTPSQIITLFEVDAEDLLLDQHIPFDRITKSDAVFRFHNNLKLSKQDIIWKGQKYIALPIIVQGYEANTKGSAPAPKLSLFSDETRVEEFKNFNSHRLNKLKRQFFVQSRNKLRTKSKRIQRMQPHCWTTWKAWTLFHPALLIPIQEQSYYCWKITMR